MASPSIPPNVMRQFLQKASALLNPRLVPAWKFRPLPLVSAVNRRELNVSLTRIQRLRAGCAVALVYLLCVMAPTIALALPGASTPDCLLLDEAVTHIHNHGADGAHQHARHVRHGDTHIHQMAANTSHLMSDKAPRGDHSSAGGSCCELMCLTALQAASTEMIPPVPLVSLRVNEKSLAMVGSAPPRLYRPPIFQS
jgi:hypothetical protein